MSKKIYFFFILVLSIETSFATNTKSSILELWVNQLIDITKNTVGYSPPISARSFAYFSISNYYATHQQDSNAVYLLNQLLGSRQSVFEKKASTLPSELLINATSYFFIQKFYQSAPTENLQQAKNLYDQSCIMFSKKYAREDIIHCANEAQQIIDNVYKISLLDGGDGAYLKNYPNDFIPPAGDSCWVRTPTSFFPSLLPYWGNNTLMLEKNKSALTTAFPMPYSTDTTSLFYKEAIEMNQLLAKPSIEQEIIAKYWDDAPGYSGTPTAHIFSVAKNLIRANRVSLEKACEIYALLGIAINDAFIVCWKLKYTYHLLRPITYIQRYINKDYNTIIVTPPFPEFPSGHSCQSGAGITVLQYYFPDAKNIIDDANKNRVDINGSPRKYANLYQIEEEISISRWYAGIHYKNTLDKSLNIGRAIGKNVIHLVE